MRISAGGRLMVRARKNPGENRGGRRQGQPGKPYPNRSDMRQAPRAIPGQTYGQAGQQLAAQHAIPLPAQASPPSAGGGGAAPPAPAPGGAPLTPIDAPTQRPGEPLTTGIAGGAGPGPEALQGATLSPIDEIRAMFAANPNDDTRRLLAYLDGT